MSNPILVEVYRDKVLESFHRGVYCIVDADKRVLFSAGNIQQVCYPRSALKFFQQLPLLTSGAFDHFGFTREELAVMCGSHNGEPDHVMAVDSILSKIGLDRSHLECGPQYPTHRPTSNELVRAGKKPEAIHNNCSGKHAGFLAQAVYGGYETKNYIDPNHPIQRAVKRLSLDFHESTEAETVTALDGCSAPIFSFTVYRQAVAYMKLASYSKQENDLGKACKTVLDAATAFPFMIAGSGRYCTDMMQVCAPQVIGKTGAEGIYSMAMPDQEIGISIKIDDGKMMPQYHVAQHLLERSGLFSKEVLEPLQSYLEKPIQNFNKWVTGKVVVAADDLPQDWALS